MNKACLWRIDTAALKRSEQRNVLQLRTADGNPITPQQAHPSSPCSSTKWFVVGAVVAAAVAIALAPATGGGSLAALAAAL
jgi:hypothetical protein